MFPFIDFIVACLLVSIQYERNIDDNFCRLTIPQGQLFGRVQKTYNNVSYYSFQGIPYAEPPLGDLRFKAPKPAKPWNGILNATQIRVICPQWHSIKEFFGNVQQNEDCLFLHIYTKTLSNQQPVMVYIPGGGFEQIASEVFFDPDYFMNEDVVLVVIQYRLSVFGFLSIDDPKYNIPGNAGFKDQVLALKWIQENIQYFGGDKDSVTIFGESAGGVSVHLLTLSPMANGLFKRAISQSGGPTDPWLTSENTYRELAVSLNCNSNNLLEIIYCFYNATTFDMINALVKLSNDRLGDIIIFNSLTIEKLNTVDPFIAEDPEVIVRNKNYNPVPFILGFCTDESALAIDYFKSLKKIPLTVESLIPKHLNIPLKTNLSKNLGKNISKIYYANETPNFESLDSTLEVLTDLLFFNSIFYFATIQSKAYPNHPIWFYEFQYRTSWNKLENYTTHTDDTLYLFRPKNRSIITDLNENIDEFIGRYRLIKLWTTFAKYGDPNPKDIKHFENIEWKPLTKDTFNYLLIKPNMELKIADSNYRHSAFWTSIFEKFYYDGF